MKKLKKIMVSILVFVTGLSTKIHAIPIPEPAYGVQEPSFWAKNLGKIIKILYLICGIIIGGYAIYFKKKYKKLPKKVLFLIITLFLLLAIVLVVIIQFFGL